MAVAVLWSPGKHTGEKRQFLLCTHLLRICVPSPDCVVPLLVLEALLLLCLQMAVVRLTHFAESVSLPSSSGCTLELFFRGRVVLQGFSLVYDFPNCCPDYMSPFLNAARSSHFLCTSNMVTSILAISLQTILPSCILCNKSLNLMHFTLCHVMVVVGLMFICKGVLLGDCCVPSSTTTVMG